MLIQDGSLAGRMDDTKEIIAQYAKQWKHPELFLPWQPDCYDPKFLELLDMIEKGMVPHKRTCFTRAYAAAGLRPAKRGS